MKLTLGFFGACALACWTFPHPAAGAEILLVHGHIYTGNPRAKWAAAIAVADDRVAAVGSDAAILNRRKAWNRRTPAATAVCESNTPT